MAIPRKEPLPPSILMDTDSYKFSHYLQYPPGTTRMMSYFESRGGEFEECTLFGLQYLLHEYLSRPITRAHVEEAAAFAKGHGVPFNYEGWMRIVEKHNGRLPVRIRAIPEGTVVPTGNVIMTVESLDPEAFWVVSWVETMLVRLWYPSTVAMNSRECKRTLKYYMELTARDLNTLPLKLHDFGSRGVASLEQARLGGAAHLLNFMGSDTVEGIRFANHYYDCDMAGISIPAAEHSTMTMWGEDGEFDAFENMVRQYLSEGALAACVSDSYDLFRAIEDGWGGERLHNLVRDSGGTLVIRPDSGDPVEVLTRAFQILEDKVGMTRNHKGFKMLPDYYRVIQGDGIDRHEMKRILQALYEQRISADNIVFGSGGGLLQKFNRDTQKWAFKCCAAEVDGKWVDVRKNPATDTGKTSKGGRMDLIEVGGQYKTAALYNGETAAPNTAMQTVFESGEILTNTTFEECRERMAL